MPSFSFVILVGLVVLIAVVLRKSGAIESRDRHRRRGIGDSRSGMFAGSDTDPSGGGDSSGHHGHAHHGHHSHHGDTSTSGGHDSGGHHSCGGDHH
jgi:hypothetical protein